MEQEQKKELKIFDEWQELQDEIGMWADSVFGDRTDDTYGISEHLIEEVVESAKAPKDILEYADCFMLLIDKMRNEGFDMNDLKIGTKRKLEICIKRNWSGADKYGIIRHK